MNGTHEHLNPDRIQAFLDARLPPPKRARVQEHMDRCERCRAEMAAWQRVFARLESVPHLAPGAGFAERVLEEVPARLPLPARMRRWVERLIGSRPAGSGHVDAPEMLDLLDGVLPAGRRRHVRSHLGSCARCRHTAEEWRAVFRELETLERFEPPVGFADAVMARVAVERRSPVPAEATADRTRSWLEKLRPRNRVGWTLVGGALGAPAMAMIVAVLAFFASQPLLTPSNLAMFLWWRTTALAQAAIGGLTAAVVDNPMIVGAWEATQGLAASPILAGTGAFAFSTATLLSLWILRRNLLSNSRARGRHANGST